MAVPRFKVGDRVKYNGDIYKIYDIKWYGLNFIYDVICVQNNFPDEFPSTSLGMGAENSMTLVDFYPPEKEKWLDEVNQKKIEQLEAKILRIKKRIKLLEKES